MLIVVEYLALIIIPDENTMIDTLLNFLGAGGITQLSTGALLLTGLLMTQITIIQCNSKYMAMMVHCGSKHIITKIL